VTFLSISRFKHGHSNIIIISARRTEWMCLWTLESWRVCQKTNYAGNTMDIRGATRGLPGAGGLSEDFSDMVVKVSKKNQKMDREINGKKRGKEFKF